MSHSTDEMNQPSTSTKQISQPGWLQYREQLTNRNRKRAYNLHNNNNSLISKSNYTHLIATITWKSPDRHIGGVFGLEFTPDR
jgi:hypothetical protein